jgi:hypothetical protein
MKGILRFFRNVLPVIEEIRDVLDWVISIIKAIPEKYADNHKVDK